MHAIPHRDLNNTAANLRNGDEESLAQKMEKFSSDWFSLLGVSSGLQGLVMDFVFNYFKRSSFHDHNGPLINRVKDRVEEISAYRILPKHD